MMFEENLINAVRKYPCLYDKNNKTSDKTQQILKRCWKNISIETGEPGRFMFLKYVTLSIHKLIYIFIT